MLRSRILLTLTLTLAGCRTTPDSNGGDTGADELERIDPRMPDWLRAPADVVRDPKLEEAAALLCARDTDGVVDEDARQAAGIVDGQVFGLLRRAPTDEEAGKALARDAPALLTSSRSTHAGALLGASPAGGSCAALVGVRRLLAVARAPPSNLAAGAALDLELALPVGRRATLFATKPDGFVARWSLPSGESAQRVSVPASSGNGRYVLEVIVDVEDGPSDPEVALVWPWVVGAPKNAPFPEVLFPDEGHDDDALTRRAEALVQRLRNEQLIDNFKLSPALVDVAVTRAAAVATRGTLGHRVDNIDPREELRIRFGDEPRAQFLRLAEVQASGSTLADAWQAMLDSPAHRYELVDTSFTHCGVAVARGNDAAGRPTVTLLALLARRPPNRDPDATRVSILGAANESREKRGLDAIVESAHLNRVATRLATAMRDARKVDDGLLGGPVAQVAIEADASLTRVKPLIVQSDDPMLLLARGVPELLMNIDVAQAGIGIALDAEVGVFYVVVLAGE